MILLKYTNKTFPICTETIKVQIPQPIVINTSRQASQQRHWILGEAPPTYCCTNHYDSDHVHWWSHCAHTHTHAGSDAALITNVSGICVLNCIPSWEVGIWLYAGQAWLVESAMESLCRTWTGCAEVKLTAKWKYNCIIHSSANGKMEVPKHFL